MLPVNTLHPVRKPAYATYGLILLNALVFLWQLTNTGQQLDAVFWNYAAVMCKVAQNPISVDTTADIIRSMFFHGGWAHLVGNMTFLWIFGRNTENYFGSGRFVLFYLLWGFIAVKCTPMSRQQNGEMISGKSSFIEIDRCGCLVVESLMQSPMVIKVQIGGQAAASLTG